MLQLGANTERTPEAEQAFLECNLPAIFLCCERIRRHAATEGAPYELALDKTYYHELGHAIMDTLPARAPNPYNETWGRVIEESLANLIAYERFEGTEAIWIQRLIQRQPAEYLGYAAAQRLLVPYDRDFWWRYYREWMEWWFWYYHEGRFWVWGPDNSGAMNVENWKAFKRKLAYSSELEEVWQKFAEHLLVAEI